MTNDEILKKIQYGDYTTLGQMLSLNPVTAKMRFFRGNIEAKEALEKIIEAREKLIEDFQPKNNSDENN